MRKADSKSYEGFTPGKMGNLSPSQAAVLSAGLKTGSGQVVVRASTRAPPPAHGG